MRFGYKLQWCFIPFSDKNDGLNDYDEIFLWVATVCPVGTHVTCRVDIFKTETKKTHSSAVDK